MNGLSRSLLLASLALLGFSLPVGAATYYWDDGSVVVNGASGGGSGAWTVGAAGWEDGSSAVNWANSNDPVFGGTAGTVTLGGPITAGTTSFNTAGYIIDTGANAATFGTLAGTGGFTKNGSATLTLSNASTASGTVQVNGGTISLGNDTALGGSNVTLNSGAIKRDNPGSTITNDILVGASGGTIIGRTSAVDGYVTYGGVLSGSGALTTRGLVKLDNTSNTYAGALTIANGSSYLQLTANEVLGDATDVTLSGGGSFFKLTGGITQTIDSLSGAAGSIIDSNGGSNILRIGANNGTGTTYSGSIGDSGGVIALVKLGTGTQTLAGTNTYSGGTTVEGGTLKMGSGSGGNTSLPGSVQIKAGGTVDVNGFGNNGGTYNIAGSGQDGAGALVNTGAATSTGLVQQPNITLSDDAAIGGTGNFYMIAGSYGANTLALSTYTLTKMGSNTFTPISTNITGTGTIDIQGGTFQLGHATLGTATSGATTAFTLANSAGAALALGKSASIGSLAGGGGAGGNVLLGSNTLTVGGLNTDTSYSGLISGAGVLIKTGSGKLTLGNSANSFTGGLQINGGTVSVAQLAGGNSPSAIGGWVGTSGFFSFNGGSLQYTGATPGVNINRAFTINAGGATIDITQSSTNVTWTDASGAGPIIGTGAFTKIGSGTLTLLGTNTYTGVTQFTAGKVAVSSLTSGTVSGPLGAANGFAANMVFNGGTLRYTGGNTTWGRALTFSGGGATFDVSNAATTLILSPNFNSAGNDRITGAGGLTKIGAGTLQLSPNSNNGAYPNFSGGATVNEGTLILQGGGSFNVPIVPGTITVNNGGTLRANMGTSIYPTALSNTITINGGGAFLINNANGDAQTTYVGTVNLDSSNGSAATVSPVTAGSAIRFGNGTAGALNSTGSVANSWSADLLLVNNSGGSLTVTAGTGNMLTISGAIRDLSGFAGAPLTKAGAGTLLLTGASNYTGATTVSSGTLALQNTTSFASAITVDPTGTLNLSRTVAGFASRSRVTRLITGSGTINVNATDNTPGSTDGGWVTFLTSGTSGLNNFTGTVNVNSGVLSIDNAGNWSGNPTLNVYDNAFFGIRNTNVSVDGLNGNGHVGNDFQGDTTGHTLTVGANGGSGDFSGVIHGSSTGGADGGIDKGILNFAKTGSGTQILSGPNTYSGTTTVQAGTLVVNGSIAASSLTTVQSGATLMGTGTVGALTINAGGTLAPGNSPGIINSGNYIQMGTLSLEIAPYVGAPVAGTDYDQLNVTGTVNLSGPLSVSYTGTAGTFNPAFAEKFTIINNDDVDAVTGTFTGLAAGTGISVDGVTLKVYYDQGTGNDVVLVSTNTSPAPITLYVDGAFTTPSTVDGDLELAGQQTAYVGTNAFDSVTTALSNYSGVDKNIILNGGTYAAAALAGSPNVNLFLVQDSTNSPAEDNVTLQSLSGDSGDGIILNYHGNGYGNLTVESGSFAGVISGNGTLTKDTSGTLTLSGANTYTGITDVNAGVLNIQNAGALGSTLNGTTVASGATLQLQGGIAVGNEGLSLTGTGTSNNGALENVSGNNSWSGGITLGGATEIQSTAGTLTLTGGISAGANALTFDGAGNTSVTSSGISGAGGSVTKNGDGTLLLSAANTYSGSTTVNAGTLHLAGGGLENSGISVSGGTFLQSAGTNHVTGSGPSSGNLTVNGGVYQLAGGTLDFQDYSAGGASVWTPAANEASTISLTTGADFEFTGGTLLDVSNITTTGSAGTFTQQGGTFVIGQDGTGPAALTTINGGFSLMDGVVRFDAFGVDPTPEVCCDGIASLNDQLTVTGDATLESVVNIDFVGFTPVFGDVFTLICANDITIGDNFSLTGGYFRVVPTGLGPGQPQYALQAIVPEPASVAIWSMIGLAGLTAAWRVRRRRKGCAAKKA